MLEQQREQQLLQAVHQQQQRQEQQQMWGRRHQPILDRIEQEVNSRSLQRWLAGPKEKASTYDHRADQPQQQQLEQQQYDPEEQQQQQQQAEWAAGSRPATFSALGVERCLVQTLTSMRIHTPTPVQVRN